VLQLVLIRHGAAEARDDFAAMGRSDRERPLTAVGRKRMREAAAGLGILGVRLDLLATSALARAAETAEIVAKALDGPAPVTLELLEPGRDPRELVRWLAAQPQPGCVACVGHEPDLGEAASLLLSGRGHSHVRFKKGAACLLELPDEISPGTAELVWSMPPGALRRLARK
jgi:phosphohistidine phosphatase